MKGKVIPFILGGTVGLITGVVYKNRIADKIKHRGSMRLTYTGCTVVSSYGSCVSVLINNKRYDLILETSVDADIKSADVLTLVSAKDDSIVDILMCNKIKVSSWGVNSIQDEKVYVLSARAVSDTGLVIEYKGTPYTLLLDTSELEEDYKENLLSSVDVLIVDNDEVFDILRVNNIDVLDWEATV